MPDKDIRYYASMMWQSVEDEFSEAFYKEFSEMSWSAKDSSLSEDIKDWKSIDSEFRNAALMGLISNKVYKQFVASYCLPVIIDGVDYTYSTRKSMLATIMDRMMSTHSKSITDMINTFGSAEKINSNYNKLVVEESFISLLNEIKVNTNLLSSYNLQKTLEEDINKKDSTFNESNYNIILWKELVYLAIVVDTCYLVPFYVFLTHASTGRFSNTREAIQLLYRDIGIITTYLSTLANELNQFFDEPTKLELAEWVHRKMEKIIKDYQFSLVENGAKPALVKGIMKYFEYSLNKTLFRLGFEEKFETVAMPSRMEQAIMQEFDETRYRFLYRNPKIRITSLGIIKKHIRRFFK